MIALDSSALVAIVKGEPEGHKFLKLISENDCIMGTPTRFETEMVIFSQTTIWHRDYLKQLLRLTNIATLEFRSEHAKTSQSAFERYGKGSGHKAQLNFGDCMAYAVARVADVPLLYKGNDFAATDIAPALTP